MSGTPTWNPPLQTSSVRFPRKAVATPQIPPNTTARPMLGAPFQPVYPNPITQIPAISASTSASGASAVYHQLYTLSAGRGDAILYPGRRGVPVPTVVAVKTAERYLVFTVNFPYTMTGTDHFVFTFTNLSTNEQTVKNFQPAPQYIVGGLLPGVLYTLSVTPVVNGITYQGSAAIGPLTISAVSEKNVQLQSVSIAGGDMSAVISWVNAIPQPPNAFEVTTVAIDDTFGTPQRLIQVISSYPAYPSPPLNYSGYVPLTGLTNGSAYTFTITPVHSSDGVYEYGHPTTLPPFIPGPPGNLVITAMSASGFLITLSATYDTVAHPVPASTTLAVYASTFTTLCSLVAQPTTVIQDNSQTYASFTTSTSVFSAQQFAAIAASVSAVPGSIQIDLLNDKGYWYTFPLTDVSTGGLGYTFGNSNFVKTTSLISTASSYSALFQTANLGAILQTTTFSSAQTSFTLPSLAPGLYTVVGTNYANGLSSRASSYATTANGPPDFPGAIVGLSGNQLVSLSFAGYTPTGTFPRPVSYLYTTTNSLSYTSITSNILITGLTNGSAYTFGIQGFANGVYGPSGSITLTPNVQPPTNVVVSSISNYSVTISFTPAFGGADYYQITNQSGQTVGLSGGLYTFQNLSANIPYTFRGQSFAGSVSSGFSLPTTPSAYVGPPGPLTVTVSGYSSQRVFFTVSYTGYVAPIRYDYRETSGKNISGSSVSSNIVIGNLTNGQSYTFSVSAFGNQVYGPSGATAGPFVLSTAAPTNGAATFSNTFATVTFTPYGTGIRYYGSMYSPGYPGTLVQSVDAIGISSLSFNPDLVSPGTTYGFVVQGVSPTTNICSSIDIVDPIIAGPPATPCNIVATLSANSIKFNWSSGNIAYTETYALTEYLVNNGVCNATGLTVSGLTGYTYTVSSVITASGTRSFGYGQWLETSPGYASFVLANVIGFTDTIGARFSRNQIYLTLQQSGLTYTFPLSTVTPFNSTSNLYANANYAKTPGDIFNPTLSISVTYSYGIGPRNGGAYSYAFASYANQVYSAPSNVGVNMFALPVSGVPAVSVVGTTATVSFAQTNPVGTVYVVTNNYGATVSKAPYTFANLSTGIPYTFSVVASNGVFVSVSSVVSPRVYMGPPPIPLVGASYFGQVATITATDTTISSTTVFYDTGAQNTGYPVTDPSHTNVIQTGSGGFWVANGNGGIKDSASGFVCYTNPGYATYSNDGYSNALYQFVVTPSTGTLTVALSAYSLTITGSSLVVTNSGMQVYSGTTLSATYPVQFISYSNGFGIQSGAGGGNNLLYYSQVPAGTDSLSFTMTPPASFSNVQAARIQPVGPATVSYGIVDQFGLVYSPSLQVATYTPSGLQYTYNIFNIPYAVTLRFGVTPYANSVSGTPAFVDIYIFTGAPGTPQVSIQDTSATITVPKVAIGSVDTYFLTVSGGGTVATLSAAATAAPAYVFQYPGLTPHAFYYFSAYATYNGAPTSTGSVTVGPYEAGRPYGSTDFPGLLGATLGNPNTTTGTYTLSALVDPGKNSNAAIITSVYSGLTFVTSQTINTSQQQVFLFTVSSGGVYTLSAAASMNGFTAYPSGPAISVSATPFPPQAVGLTISSSDLGATYQGAITITASSSTPNVTYLYGYIKDGTTFPASTTSTLNAVYNSSYTAYAYTIAVGGTSSITYSALCNVFISPATTVLADYSGTVMTLTWTGATDGLTNDYTVITSNTTANTSAIVQNIPYSGLAATLSYSVSGTLGNAYTFSVLGQSTANPSASLLYSTPVSANVVLFTQSVAPVATYSGAAITVSFSIATLTFSSLYTFGVTCICGTVTNNTVYADPTATNYSPTGYSFTASGLGQILQFSVQPYLKGIYGVSTQTSTVNLTTSAMTNVTQSYTGVGNQYTISWTPYGSGYTYTVTDLNKNISAFTTTANISTFTLTRGLSYQFQTYAMYNGISSAVTTLSAVYMYTNPISGAPTTTYSGTTMTLTWSAVIQPDGNFPDYYQIQNVYTGGPSVNVSTAATSISYIGITGRDYTFSVTPVYHSIPASTSLSGVHVGLYTYPATNVQIANSGQTIVVTWSASPIVSSAQNTIVYTLSQTSGTTITPGVVSTSGTVYAPIQVLPVDATKFYNYVITASANGFASSGATASICGLVYTYPPSAVTLDYLGDDTRTSHNQPNGTIGPIVTWVNTMSQASTASYTISLVDSTTPTNTAGLTNVGKTNKGATSWSNTDPNNPTIEMKGHFGNYMVPYVYATNNGLVSTTVSGSPVRLFTDTPGIVGAGFDGLYRITINICAGSTGNAPEFYTVKELNNAFSTNINSYLYPNSIFTIPFDKTESTVFQLPLAGTQGYTYNFQIYATQKGVVSSVNTTLSAYKLATTAVTSTSTSVTYSSTTITFTWSDAAQKAYDGTTSPPNGGYTIYVTPGNPYIPLTNLYYDTCYKFVGVPGQSYFFTIEAVNNNITSSPTQSPTVTLYQPVVTNLAATNSCTNGVDVSMILTWTPDILNASGATYYAVAYNQTTGRTVTSTTSANANTVLFTGSIGVTYTFYVEGIYQGISGLAQSVQMTNARPVITSFSLTNLGNNIFAQYTVTPVGSPVTLSAYNATTSTNVTTICYTSATTATLTVSSATGSGYTYTISATATCNGIPSTVCGATYTMIQPNTPAPVSAVYNNTLVSVSWSSVTNASSYTFTAYDLSTNQQANSQSYIPQSYTTFVGTLGHSYTLSVTAYSATYIPSVTANTSVAISIPPPPSGLSLSNAGTLVTVSWTTDAKYSNYSFTVVNASSAGTIVYQSFFANSGDTFLATVGQTFRVSLYGTSLCNVTSTSAAVSSLFIYQPSITSVTATSVGADITLTFPPDSQKTCEYLITNNFGYQTLVYSSSKALADISAQYNAVTTSYAPYSQPKNGYISYLVANCSYTLAGNAYQFTVVPYYRLVPGQGAQTPGVNPLTLYKPSTPGQFTVTNQGNDLLLNWQSSAIDTTPVPTLVPTYKVEVSQVTASGSFPNAVSPKYITGTSTTFTGYDSGAGQLSISVTAILPGYDTNLSADYIYGYTANKTYAIPNQTSISIKQTDYNNPQNLSVTIPPMAAPWIWFLTSAAGVTPTKNYYTAVSNVNQTIFQTCNVTVSTGLYYTISAYGWADGTSFPGPASAIAVANANPNPYPATTFNVSYASIQTSHSGTTITVSWAAVPQAGYYQTQVYDSTGTPIGGGDIITSPIWTSVNPKQVAGSYYNIQITAFTISQARFNGGTPTGQTVNGLPSGASLPNNCNVYFPVQSSSNENLTIPGPVVALTAVQTLQTVGLTWLQPNTWTPSTPNTTTSANTSYYIQQISGVTVVSNATISGGGTPPSYTFNIVAGTTYTFTVSTTYYGIQTTTPTSVAFTTINPSITGLTLTDNGNKTITLAGTASTAGNWYANIGSAANYPSTATQTNSTTFSLSQLVTAGSSWTGFVKFVAGTGGLSVTSNTTQLTLPNPALLTATLTDNSSVLPASFTLSIPTSGTGGVVNAWTIPTTDSTGTFSNTSSTLNGQTLTAVYQAITRPITVPFVNAPYFDSNTIVLTSDGFAVSNVKTSNFIPPTLVTTATLGPTGSPASLNLGLSFTSNGVGTTALLNFPTTIGGLNTATSSPQTASLYNVTYPNMAANTTYSIGSTDVYAVFQQYKSFAASTNTKVAFSVASVTFTDNTNGTASVTATYGSSYSGGSGNPSWTFPSAVGTLSVSGSTTSTSSPAVAVYKPTTDGSSYTLTANAVSLTYGGITLTGPASGSTIVASVPHITSLTSSYFGCRNDNTITGSEKITVSAGASATGTWTISFSTTDLTLSAGANPQTGSTPSWVFSGGKKGSNYVFSISGAVLTTNVTLTQPGGTVTPAFSSVNVTSKTVTSSLVYGGGATNAFVWLGSKNSNTTLTSATLAIDNYTVDTYFTVSAAPVLNGVLGPTNSYQFLVSSAPTLLQLGSTNGANDGFLSSGEHIWLSWVGVVGATSYTIFQNGTALSPNVSGTSSNIVLPRQTGSYAFTVAVAGPGTKQSAAVTIQYTYNFYKSADATQTYAAATPITYPAFYAILGGGGGGGSSPYVDYYNGNGNPGSSGNAVYGQFTYWTPPNFTFQTKYSILNIGYGGVPAYSYTANGMRGGDGGSTTLRFWLVNGPNYPTGPDVVIDDHTASGGSGGSGKDANYPGPWTPTTSANGGMGTGNGGSGSTLDPDGNLLSSALNGDCGAVIINWSHF